jgi:hypothetical protein
MKTFVGRLLGPRQPTRKNNPTGKRRPLRSLSPAQLAQIVGGAIALGDPPPKQPPDPG